MPPKQNKPETKTYKLFPRGYDDPRGYGEGATGVFAEVQDPNKARKSKPKAITRSQLEKDKEIFKASGQRDNEGEAALYGITFDDSNYDYMQHLKPIGENPEAYFIGANGKISDSYIPPQAKDKLTLGELLNGAEYQDSRGTFKEHYQAQLPIQDSIRGFQPNMDPQLAEVLDALDDDAFIEGEENDIFAELVKTGEVKDEKEWKELNKQPEQKLEKRADEEDWEFAFRKFKIEEKQLSDPEGSDDINSLVSSGPGFGSEDGDFDAEEAKDVVGELPATKQSGKKKKKRIGAKTDLTGFSMSSSANFRNAGLQLLDDTFDKVEEDYLKESSEEEDEEFDMNKERSDLNSIMDEFLNDFVVEGKHLYKRSK